MFNPELAATVSSSRPLESQTRALEVFPIYDDRVRLVGYAPKLFPGFIPASTVDPGSKLYTTPIQQSILRLAPVVPHDLSYGRAIVVTLLLLTHISLSTSNISPTDISLEITVSSD
ncbi:hypothetical protein GEMRC1_002301 [Eukaryota sp. GEM-RC1]